MKSTDARILEAATRVFARDGVTGATTREIAREAKVNEVTLFRHFKNKEELLRQVILECSKRHEHLFVEAPMESQADVHRTVQDFALSFSEMLVENEDFVRTFFGELNRHIELCKRLFVDSAKPGRQRFIAYLLAAQKRGFVRAGLDIPTTADSLTGMLLAGTIRRPLMESHYSNKRYVKTCLEIFLKGIEP